MRCQQLAVTVLLILIGMTTGGCEPIATPPIPRDAPDKMETFCDRAGGYQVRFPTTWELTDRTADDHMIRADIRSGREVGLQIRMYDNVEVPLCDFLDGYARQFSEEMLNHWGGHLQEAKRQVGRATVGESAEITYTHRRRDGEYWFFKQYLWSRDGCLVVFQCGTLNADRDENEPALDQIAETFQWAEP